MARRTQPNPSGPQAPRPMIVAGVLIVFVVFAGAAVYRYWGAGATEVSAEDLSRVLVVAAAPDENGDVLGQIIAIADVTASPAMFEAVSPALEVTIPGTTYSALGDAYPFGGGAGTAEALARAEGGEPLPYVAIDAAAFEAALQAAGPVRVTLPADMSVFDGDELYTFDAGEQVLSAAELLAVLKGAPYLTRAEREKLDASLAGTLASALAALPETLEGVDTNLSAEAIARLREAF